MSSIIFRGKQHVWLKNKRDRQLFFMLNLSLFIGATILIGSLVYILFNLGKPERTIFFCLPGISIGLVFIIIYSVGFVIMLKKVKDL